MKFIDNTIILINAGNGGNGCINFIKLKSSSYKKIPNGGCGGNGGNIYIISNKSVYCLSKLNSIKNFFADNGDNGRKNNCTGKCGKDLFIKVPIGTMIFDYNTKEFLFDFKKDSQKLLIARGGFRGFGNKKINSLINKYSNEYIIGKKGEKKILQLKLELISDVGIFGLTNSGKSVFFKFITNINNVKISNYLFTTQFPSIGISYLNKYNFFSIIDTPGFMFDNKFNNINFLNHLNRCKLLLHIIDISFLYYKDKLFIKYINKINKEFYLKNVNLYSKKIWIIFNLFDIKENIFDIKIKIDIIFKKFNIKFDYYIVSLLKDFNFYKNIKSKIYKFLLNKKK